MAHDDPRHRNLIFQAQSAGDYVTRYTAAFSEAMAQVDKHAVDAAYALIEQALLSGNQVLAAGNGGSAAIADHLVCDWMKGTRAPGQPILRVHSLISDTALITAISNDHGFDKIFSTQIEMLGRPGDVCVLVSSSGNSANMVQAVEAAIAQEMQIIGLTGFSGGVLHQRAHIGVHVPVHNYGLVEDCHQAIMHSIAQFLAKRQDERAAL